MGSLNLDRLLFDPADTADSSNIGAYLRAGSDGDLISSTLVSGKEGLDVNLVNTSVVVSATDLDIRNLSAAQDTVAISDGTDTLAVNVDGSINSVVTATNLDIRDLTHVSDSIKIGDGTDFLLISAAGEASVLAAGTFLEDSAHVSGDRGFFQLAVRNDAETSLVSNDGDYAPLQVNAAGRLKVDADLSVSNSFEKTEDSAHVSGDIGAYTLGVVQGTLASSVSNDGDYGSFKLNDRGAMWTSPIGTAADDAADTENPVKVGGRAYTGASALTALSATGDRSDLAMDLYRRVYINDAPNVSVLSTRVSVGALATAVPTTALAGRTKLTIQNIANNSVWIGSSAVTTSGSTTGLLLGKGSTVTLEAGQGVSYFAISALGGDDVIAFEQA